MLDWEKKFTGCSKDTWHVWESNGKVFKQRNWLFAFYCSETLSKFFAFCYTCSMWPSFCLTITSRRPWSCLIHLERSRVILRVADAILLFSCAQLVKAYDKPCSFQIYTQKKQIEVRSTKIGYQTKGPFLPTLKQGTEASNSCYTWHFYCSWALFYWKIVFSGTVDNMGRKDWEES